MAATAAYYPRTPSHFSSPPPHTAMSPHVQRISSPQPAMQDTHASATERRLPRHSPPADSHLVVTPIKDDFGGIPGQRPLPESPFTPTAIKTSPVSPRSHVESGDLKRAVKTPRMDADDDVDMDDGDDLQEESDNDSADGDAADRPKKKKKGMRFYCTDFAPCNLSFTRSEHLARHIRKHTGERPFTCHCNRRFSRLDNLRQHAQTVHVNEDIPGDSLAATGTRFQRQIRTDRVRAPGGRARAGTGSSAPGHVRGHSRNLSSSSIASTASNVSLLPDDVRRRPPALTMAPDGTPGRRLVVDPYALPGAPQSNPQYAYYPPQPSSGQSTPTSATFSTTGNSPRFMMQSPSVAQRPAYYQPTPTSARRLSVPSAQNPFQQPPPPLYSPFAHPQAPYHSPNASTSSIMSPTGSTYGHSRRESELDLEWRRRTWHPGTINAYAQRPATSGLMYQQTPDDVRPTTAGQAAASQLTRLPGIESFDHPTANAGASLAGGSGPVHPDASRHAHLPSVEMPPASASRRPSVSWETNLQQNLGRLDITNATPPRVLHARPPLPTFSFPQAPPNSESSSVDGPNHADPFQSAGDRRRGWYGGPSTASLSQPIAFSSRRVSPVDSNSSESHSTSVTSQGSLVYSAMRPGGTHERQLSGGRMGEDHAGSKPDYVRTDSGSHLYEARPPLSSASSYSAHSDREIITHQPRPRPANDMGRLEALVAVATSENAMR